MKLHPIGHFDNSAADYEYIRAVPLAAAMGAEIQGVQIKDVDERSFPEIAHALYRHGMIFFRDQDMSLSDQERFTLRFGEFGTDAYTKGVEGHPNVQRVAKEADVRTKHIFGGGWHTDSPFLARPPAVSLLFGADVPPYGGDTIWANTPLAFRTLSETMQSMLRGLRVRMSARDVLALVASANEAAGTENRLASMELKFDAASMIEGAAHPLVRTHPVTGVEALYVDGSYAVGIEGLTDREAAPLLQFLVEHITQHAFTCRLRWAKNTFAVWDNRLCLHQAFNDHDGFRREMYRTTVMGEVPV
jgi:taurine dioxygenase